MKSRESLGGGSTLPAEKEVKRYQGEYGHELKHFHSIVCTECGKSENCPCELNQDHSGICKTCLNGEDKIKEMEIKPHGSHMKICSSCGSTKPCEGTCNYLINHSTTCDICLSLKSNEKYL